MACALRGSLCATQDERKILGNCSSKRKIKINSLSTRDTRFAHWALAAAAAAPKPVSISFQVECTRKNEKQNDRTYIQKNSDTLSVAAYQSVGQWEHRIGALPRKWQFKMAHSLLQTHSHRKSWNRETKCKWIESASTAENKRKIVRKSDKGWTQMGFEKFGCI